MMMMMMMMMSNPPLNPESLDPMTLANSAMEQCFPLIAGSAMTDEFKDLTTNLVFEFAKIAGQLIQQEPSFQPPESPAPIHFTHAMCEQTVQLFVEGLIQAAMHGWQQGIPSDPLSQILQTLAQDLFFQTKQMVASTVAMEGLPEELQQTLAPEQMQAIAHQTAVNGLEYFTQQFEDQVGPIERQYPQGTLEGMAEGMPSGLPEMEPPPETEAPEVPMEDTALHPEQSNLLEAPEALPALQTQDVLDDTSDPLLEASFSEEMREPPHPESSLTSAHWDENPEAAFQTLEQLPPEGSKQAPQHAPQTPEEPLASSSEAQRGHESKVSVAHTQRHTTQHTHPEDPHGEEPLALEPVTPELLAALALYSQASHAPPGETVRLHVLCPQLSHEEWHQVATYKTLDPDVLLRSESNLNLKRLKHYLVNIQHQMTQLLEAQAQGNWGEQTARLAQLQERKAGMKWANQMKLLFQHYAPYTHQLIPLIQKERERVQQVLAEGLYAISVDSPIQWKDIPVKTREALFEYFQEKLYSFKHHPSKG
ncbi:MAG: hypothetical protein ACKO37_08835 [Vampirovibrionales bacterium]